MLLIGVQDIVQQSAHQTLEIEDIRIREKTVAQGKAMLGQERFARYITMGRQEAWDLVASVIDGSFSAVQATTLRFPLTRREHDVLALLAPGHTNREIADRLFLSPRTVDSHVASIMSKLGVHTRHAALARARELELIA